MYAKKEPKSAIDCWVRAVLSARGIDKAPAPIARPHGRDISDDLDEIQSTDTLINESIGTMSTVPRTQFDGAALLDYAGIDPITGMYFPAAGDEDLLRPLHGGDENYTETECSGANDRIAHF
jgi:hypothetical protein